MSLACSAMWGSVMAPSSSALGTRAATESTQTTSTLADLMKVSTTSKACSPVSGWDKRRVSVFTPIWSAYSLRER